MLSQQDILDFFSKNLNAWSGKYGVKKIGLFGSYGRDEQKDSSDIDVIWTLNFIWKIPFISLWI